jgi:GNAT superfamily N-acetyltransferase
MRNAISGGVEIRLLRPTDSIGDLTALLHRAYAALGAMGLNYTAVDQSEAVTRSRIRNGECFIADAGGRLVGTIQFRSAAQSSGCPWYDRPEVASFHQFGVLPELQGGGLGLRLLETVERRARETGAEELALDTAEPAQHLVRFYEKRGYRHVEFVQVPGKTYRSVIMSKRVARPSAA